MPGKKRGSRGGRSSSRGARNTKGSSATSTKSARNLRNSSRGKETTFESPVTTHNDSSRGGSSTPSTTTGIRTRNSPSRGYTSNKRVLPSDSMLSKTGSSPRNKKNKVHDGKQHQETEDEGDSLPQEDEEVPSSQENEEDTFCSSNSSIESEDDSSTHKDTNHGVDDGSISDEEESNRYGNLKDEQDRYYDSSSKEEHNKENNKTMQLILRPIFRQQQFLTDMDSKWSTPDFVKEQEKGETTQTISICLHIMQKLGTYKFLFFMNKIQKHEY